MILKSIRSMRRSAGIFVACLCVMMPASAIETFEGFDDYSGLTSKGWNFQNLSNPLGDLAWFQGDTVIFDAQAGPDNSYLAANFDNVNGLGTISNWAITPMLMYSNGDTFSFYSRTEAGSTWPDRLEVRLSTQGNSSNVGSSDTSVGDFTDLLLTVNPGLTVNGYPEVWTKYDITLSGLSGPTTGRIAFRYFVTNAGSQGDFGNYIGIDSLLITTAVPEPSTWVLCGLSVGALGLGIRRKVNRSGRGRG
ncbi:PEP-CTERM sorting domain-containing protein [bacterium]|nr:PEP-CTERM sorting domain-containing protein [bacterium]